MRLPYHTHLFVAGDDSAASPLVLLHGSGGSEHDLIALAEDLAPERSILAIRGATPWDGGFAFFRRFADRSIDEVDLRRKATALAGFINNAHTQYGFSKAPIAIGFSNGAIMASALLLMNHQIFSGSILFRPLSPFQTESQGEMPETPILIVDGELDARRSRGDGSRLAERLAKLGARVEHHALPIGHSITAQDIHIAREWLARSL